MTQTPQTPRRANRILSVCLSFALMLSLIPSSALSVIAQAAETDGLATQQSIAGDPADSTKTDAGAIKTDSDEAPATDKDKQDETSDEQGADTDGADEADDASADKQTDDKSDVKPADPDGKKSEDEASKTAPDPSNTSAASPEKTTANEEMLGAAAATPSISYNAHLQEVGWQGWAAQGEVAGTTGQKRRVEALRVSLPEGTDGSLRYRAHVQEIGWQDWVEQGDVAGTTGSELRLEAFQLELTGALVNTCDVYYRVHVENYGWLNWAKNGEEAGTMGLSARIEALQIYLLPKDSAAPSEKSDCELAYLDMPELSYRAHVSYIGWQEWVESKATAGTEGERRPMEAFELALGKDSRYSGGIEVKGHVQSIGWQDEWSSMAGTTGHSLRLEAVQAQLTGDLAEYFDLYYRVHVEEYGWMNWACNGQSAGTEGLSYRVEAIQMCLVAKGFEPPVVPIDSADPFVACPKLSYQAHVQNIGWQGWKLLNDIAGTTGSALRMEAFEARLNDSMYSGDIQLNGHVQNIGWQNNWSNIAGTTGNALRLEAVEARLTDKLADYFDIYYRVHIEGYGWLGWAKNGEPAGSTGNDLRMEAIQMVLTKKYGPAPGPTNDHYISQQNLNGVDISGWDRGININNLDADFVIIKSTEGVQGTCYNPDYMDMANSALANGKKIGFYHYANGGNAIAEADCFYESIKGYQGRAVACLDWEGQGNPTFNTGGDVIWCRTFLDRLRSRFGGTPFVYMSKSVANTYNWSSVSGTYPLWGAEYPDYNPIYGYQNNPWQSRSPWGSWGSLPTIFQYTSVGRLERNGGIPEFDFNKFYGSTIRWDSYCR